MHYVHTTTRMARVVVGNGSAEPQRISTLIEMRCRSRREASQLDVSSTSLTELDWRVTFGFAGKDVQHVDYEDYH